MYVNSRYIFFAVRLSHGEGTASAKIETLLILVRNSELWRAKQDDDDGASRYTGDTWAFLQFTATEIFNVDAAEVWFLDLEHRSTTLV